MDSPADARPRIGRRRCPHTLRHRFGHHFLPGGAARFGTILHRPLAGAHQTLQPEQHRALHDRLGHTPPPRGGRQSLCLCHAVHRQARFARQGTAGSIGGRAGKEIPYGQRNGAPRGRAALPGLDRHAGMPLAGRGRHGGGGGLSAQTPAPGRAAERIPHAAGILPGIARQPHPRGSMPRTSARPPSRLRSRGDSPCCATSPQPITPMAKGNGWRGR